MSVAAVAMIKDEADVIERTLRHFVAEGVDAVYLAENASTDGTWELVRDLRDGEMKDWLRVLPDPEEGYWQSRKMTWLAGLANSDGHDWVIPFDADELWRAPGTLAEHFASVERRVGMQRFPILNHYCTALDAGGHPYDAMRWYDEEPLPLPKVAVRARGSVVIEAGNHSASGFQGVAETGYGCAIHHYPYRSHAQIISKVRNGAAAYAATNLPRSTGQHWREMGECLVEHGEAGLRAWFDSAFYFADPEASGLVLDPVRSPRGGAT